MGTRTRKVLVMFRVRKIALVGWALLAASAASGVLQAAAPAKRSRPAYETEVWPKARRLVWARPGASGEMMNAANWLENGRPASQPPNRDTDILLPPAAKRYTVRAGRHKAVRHAVIEKNAFLIGQHRGECEIWGNLWVKKGGWVYYVSVRGPKHTFFRIDDGEFPNPANGTRYRHTSRGGSKLSRTQISHKFQVCKYGNASVEFIGRFGVSDEIMIQHGKMIISGDLRWSGVTSKGALEIYDGGILELQSGSTIGPFQSTNRKRVFNIDVYRNGVIQAGSPERPLTSNAYLMLGYGPNDRPGTTGLYAAAGSQIRVYSADPTRAKLVITSITSQKDFTDGKGRIIGRPAQKAQGSSGVALQLAGDVQLDGVLFDYICEGGIHLASPAMRKSWTNVSFGSHCAAPPERLFAKLTINPNVYYHNRGDGKSEFGLTTTAVKSMAAYMKRHDKYRISVHPSPVIVKSDGGFNKPLAVVFNKPVDVTIRSAVAGATIHYTLDGHEPTKTSPRYTGPVRLSKTTRLKARAFKAGMEPSNIFSAAYVLK